MDYRKKCGNPQNFNEQLLVYNRENSIKTDVNLPTLFMIRGLFMESPDLMTKVSEIGSGTQRTLADLWKINRAMCSLLPAAV